jgi:8-oxo-dGTP diphosphatase
MRESFMRCAAKVAGLIGTAARLLILAAVLCVPGACAEGSPACPFTGKGDTAPSAGCFVASGEGLLLVQGLNGKVSLPGGSREPGESAQCTAFRETWEETGLSVQPRELLRVFSTGFHLYRCERDASSGDINPPPRFEVRTAFFLPADRFDTYDWRFEDQRELLKSLLLDAAPVEPE